MKYLACAGIFLASIIVQCTPPAAAEELSWLDSTESAYAAASRDYESAALMDAAEAINKRPLIDRQSPRTLLLLGLMYWRMELIAYCSNDKARISHYGGLALSTLDEAEKNGADPYMAAGHRALACQLIAGQGIVKGAKYGPRAAAELKKARKANPQGYYSLLVEAINTSQAPSFAGGDPAKAALLLEKMEKEFPDSIDVKIHLSRAYRKAKRLADARAEIQPIIKAHPKNLLARMVWDETMQK